MSNALASNSVLQNLYWNQLTKIQGDQQTVETAKSLIGGIASLEDSFAATVSAINQNGDLSAQGRASALLTQSKKSLATLDAQTKSTLAKLDAAIVENTRALRKAASGVDASTVTELRAVEARAAFSQIDLLFREDKYLRLCESGLDDNSCLAVENASAFAPLLKADVIEQGRALRGARTLPDQAAALDSAVELKAILSASAASARRNMSLGVTNNPLQVAPLAAFPIDGDDA